jgi:thiamine biosynthesis lipoprotein ApbE
MQTARVHRALINFGESSLYLLGTPPHGTRWPIVIRGLAEGDLIGLLWVKQGALSTSSSLRGERHTGHILDPQSDLLIDEPRLSTILAPSATLAEALSTAAVVRGAAWRALLAAFPEVEGLYVGPDRIPGVTDGLLEQFQAVAEGT